MKMAKASEADIDMALNMISVLDDIEKGYFPHRFNPDAESIEWQHTNKRTARQKADPATHTKCTSTADLFEQLKAAALDDLNKAVTACQSVGITVTLNIEEL